MKLQFNRPYMTGKELRYISQAHHNNQLAGDGPFTRKCSDWLRQYSGANIVLLTHSCTAALEMAAILIDAGPGDEVIMPSYTFVSTANAFVLRGATPVFVDIRPDTQNIDENLIEQAITPKTKAIVVVHYAGVGCEMNKIIDIAKAHNLPVIEDAAQGMVASYDDRPLGSIGDLGCISFHETKNVISGEGGCLFINNPDYVERAEIIREKGTNRSNFKRGKVDKYTWVDIGSSYLPGEVTAAFLYAQLEEAYSITQARLKIWDKYHREYELSASAGEFSRPTIPANCQHNAHMYYLILSSEQQRNEFIEAKKDQGMLCLFHYVPLHSSPAGLKYGRVSGTMEHTDRAGSCLVRLPLWVGMEK